MPLSLNSSDVKTISGIAAVVAGMIIIAAGIYREDTALITFGAGLIGAPGIATTLRQEQPLQEDSDEQGT